MEARAPVDVVIPTRDRDAMLAEAVASVLAQDPAVTRVIVVADGPRLPVLPAAERARVELVRNEGPPGAPGARNTGLARATSDWLVFLDDDDVWDADYTRVMEAERARAGPEVVALFPGFRARLLDASLRELPRPAAPPSELELLRMNLVGTTSFVLCRRAAVVELAGFDTSLTGAQDWDLWLRLRTRGLLVPVPRLVGTYRVHGAGQLSSPSPGERYRRYRPFFAKRLGHPLVSRCRRELADEVYWWGVLMAWTGDVAGARDAMALVAAHGVVHLKARLVERIAGSRFRRELLWLIFGWRERRMQLEDRREPLALA